MPHFARKKPTVLPHGRLPRRSGCVLRRTPPPTHSQHVSARRHRRASAWCTHCSLCARCLLLCCGVVCPRLASAGHSRSVSACRSDLPPHEREGAHPDDPCTMLAGGLPPVPRATPAAAAAAVVQQPASAPAAAQPPKRSHHAKKVRHPRAPMVPRAQCVARCMLTVLRLSVCVSLGGLVWPR